MNKCVILLLLLTGCAKQAPNVVNIEAKYQPYTAAFQARAQMVGSTAKVDNLIVQSVDTLGPSIVAQCIQGGDNPTIQVSQFFWNRLPVTYREEVIFHEMGHCVLNRGHRPDQNNSLSLSIMDPYIFGGSAYESNYTQYMHELFYQTDLASALPLVLNNTDPTYMTTVQNYFSNYTTNASSFASKVVDNEAPLSSDLTAEELAQLNCGE